MLLSLVTHPYTYLAAWAFLGLAMRMTLYDAAFAALVQVTPSRGRRAISYLTLFGGFASSVFWPIGHALNAAYGWRTTLLVFAAINLVVCLPLHWLGLARRETGRCRARPAPATPRRPADPPLEGAPARIGMVLFSFIVAASAVVFGALAVHLVPILEATGLARWRRPSPSPRSRASPRWPGASGTSRSPASGTRSTSAASPSSSCRCRSPC